MGRAGKRGLWLRQPRRGWLAWILYACSRCIVAVLLALPWGAGRAAAGFVGDLAYLFDSRERRDEALANLQRAFPGRGKAWSRKVLRGVYRHMAVSVVDSLHFVRRARRRDPAELFEVIGFEKLRAVGDGRGVIFVTGHFGHWEVLGAASAFLGYPVWSMGRRLRNVYLDAYVQKMRQSTGQRILDKDGGLRSIIRLLRRGENVAILIDQDMRRDGIFVDFFGRPASTTAAPARLSMRTGAPVAFVYARLLPAQRRFRIVLKDVIPARTTGDSSANVRDVTQQLTSHLEELVRQSPEEWLWLHRRWKTFPGKYGPA